MKKLLILLLLLIVNQGFSQKSYKNFAAKKDSALWKINGANIFSKNSGNVGIGATVPNTKLHVSNNGGAVIKVESDNGFAGFRSDLSDIKFYTGVQSFGNPRYAIVNNTTTANEVISIPLATNNVGIGTVTPAEKLEVNGKIKATTLQITTPTTANSANPFFYAVLDASGNVLKEPIVSTLSPVLNNTITTPPTSPSVDDAYLIPTGATGVWLSQTNKIATWSGASWVFYTPVLNDKTSVLTGVNVGLSYTFDGTNWVVASVPASNNFALDGNNVTAVKKLGTISNFDLPIITNNVERLRVTTAGNLGIGTTAPTSSFHLISPSIISLNTSTTYAAQFSQSSGLIGIGGDANFSYLQSFNSKPLQINNVGNNIILNATAGNVSIGTISPVRKLDVFGNNANLGIVANGETQTASLFFGTNAPTGVPGGGGNTAVVKTAIIAEGSGGFNRNNLHFCLNGNASNELTDLATIVDAKMSILNTGNVGIGTRVPTSKLDVRTGTTTVNSIANATGSINDYLQYNIQNTSTGTQSQSGYSATADNGTATTGFAWMGINNSTFNFPTTYNAGTSGDVTYVGSGQDLIIANANQTKAIKFQTGKAVTPFFDDRMTILNNGNVGIGTTTPVAKLDVAGQVKISGGTPGVGKVLTSDANGLSSWQSKDAFSAQIAGAWGAGKTVLTFTNKPNTRYLVTINAGFYRTISGLDSLILKNNGVQVLALQYFFNTPNDHRSIGGSFILTTTTAVSNVLSLSTAASSDGNDFCFITAVEI